jgi:hypothetical protein
MDIKCIFDIGKIFLYAPRFFMSDVAMLFLGGLMYRNSKCCHDDQFLIDNQSERVPILDNRFEIS